MAEKPSSPDPKRKQDTLVPGDSRIRNKAGQVGIFQGVRIVGEAEYLRVLFNDPNARDEESRNVESLVPRQQLGKGKRFEVFTPEEVATREALMKDPAAQARVDELEAKPIQKDSILDKPEDFGDDDYKAEFLRDYIRVNQDYNFNSLWAQASPEIKVRVAELLIKAKERDYLFRGDGRHPYGKGAYEDMLKVFLQKTSERLGEPVPIILGPFEDGFGNSDSQTKRDGWGYDASHLESQVIISADLEMASGYPQAEFLPPEWDRMSYLYFIKPDACVKEFASDVYGDLEYMVENSNSGNEIGLNKISPADVAFAISIDRNKNEITGVFENPMAIKKKE